MAPIALVILTCVPVLMPSGFTFTCVPSAVTVHASMVDCQLARIAIDRSPRPGYGHCLPITAPTAPTPTEQGS